ncbi:MAG: hypothetical protein IPI26_00075 [Elusimicrobia bacterium]|nr:hypothetical protein [Elusimicrobiota bacterium]
MARVEPLPRNLPPMAAVLEENRAIARRPGKKNLRRNSGKNPGRWPGERQRTLRLIRLLENPRTRLASVGRRKTGARAARRHEERAPPPGPLGVWADWDAGRSA